MDLETNLCKIYESRPLKTQRFATPYKKRIIWIRALGLFLRNNIVFRNLANQF
ncbi:hypothetical protein HMPREF1439_01409 [Helicobacter pylori HP250AFiii]|nr:hypothetical protein HMPREF1439_01409 [Helicobacter pylori HP250AFiii]EMH56047.1 hypothetical protein HMPREF1444_01293 [Helicobacter pylori HP250BFii]EMH57500.1 hypothetical protein HMPREF1445_00919 [Helicobacter pylori HP250BFiii]